MTSHVYLNCTLFVYLHRIEVNRIASQYHLQVRIQHWEREKHAIFLYKQPATGEHKNTRTSEQENSHSHFKYSQVITFHAAQFITSLYNLKLLFLFSLSLWCEVHERWVTFSFHLEGDVFSSSLENVSFVELCVEHRSVCRVQVIKARLLVCFVLVLTSQRV